MGVVLRRGDRSRDDENAPLIDGRPDLPCYGDRHGVTRAKKWPPYVFSVRRPSALVHRVAYVDMHWYRVARGGNALARLKRPVLIASTPCGMSFRLQGENSRTCVVPASDALLCGRCHGRAATFSRKPGAEPPPMTREEAHVKLGCAVLGY